MILKRVEKDNLVKAIFDSSNVIASIYDNTTNDLTIIFKSGSKYKYNNVSKSDYMRFEIADSQGSVFNTHIKKYTFEKLENVDISKIIAEVTSLKNDERKAIITAKKNRITELMKLLSGDSVNLEDKINELNELVKLSTEFINYLNTENQ